MNPSLARVLYLPYPVLWLWLVCVCSCHDLHNNGVVGEPKVDCGVEAISIWVRTERSFQVGTNWLYFMGGSAGLDSESACLGTSVRG